MHALAAIHPKARRTCKVRLKLVQVDAVPDDGKQRRGRVCAQECDKEAQPVLAVACKSAKWLCLDKQSLLAANKQLARGLVFTRWKASMCGRPSENRRIVFDLCSVSTGKLNFFGTSSSAYDFGCFTAAIPTPTAFLWGTHKLDSQENHSDRSVSCAVRQPEWPVLSAPMLPRGACAAHPIGYF